MKILMLLLFVSSSLLAQQIKFSGKLADLETNEPIVYANISFLDAKKGISTTQDGVFSMNLDQKYLNSKIHISCLNYKDTIVLARELQNKTIFLMPKVFELDEVLISKKNTVEIELDKVKRRVTPFHTNNIRMIAKYFPNTINNYELYISKIKIYFSKKHSVKAKFRIRIFSVNSNNKPDKDLLVENILVTLNKGQTKVVLDLTNYDIEFPEKGVYVAFEKLLVPENLYKRKLIEKNTEESYYAPVIGLTKIKEFKDTNRVCVFNKGFWFDVPMPEDDFSFVPAISLTLNN